MQKNRRFCLIIAAKKPVGILYGVYGLLEELGMGFYAGGDAFPELPTQARIASAFEKHENPVFAVRGNMLHYNFLCGCTNWGLDDYKFYFDQLARMRSNLLLMHWYDCEPGAAFEQNGEYVNGGITPNEDTSRAGHRHVTEPGSSEDSPTERRYVVGLRTTARNRRRRGNLVKNSLVLARAINSAKSSIFSIAAKSGWISVTLPPFRPC